MELQDQIKKLEKLVGLGLKTVSEQQEKIRQLQGALEEIADHVTGEAGDAYSMKYIAKEALKKAQ